MKATGIVRRVDQLGRVVLPVELRKTFDIKKEDPLEIYVDGDTILLKKYEPACIFCGNAKNVKRIYDKAVCEDCLSEMKNL
ncbi:MAG: AbrB/MazE/SpoVT family DNA-binding domain-containing protein [Clostridiales Family XIII bacterium]|jgi:transcriptional pleiotropic regulator of transition state genes|nr:AbrB/MazE/SpoVT family DNA-binding domain-containing protein [Clostridiales Family XIII bacterium]